MNVQVVVKQLQIKVTGQSKNCYDSKIWQHLVLQFRCQQSEKDTLFKKLTLLDD